MDILLVVRDNLVRDQIKVGLQQFQEFTITVGEGYAAINEARQHHYDSVFISVDPQRGEGLRLLQHLRSFDRTMDVVIVTTERHARDMAGEKSRLNISSFLSTPIDVTEFFRLIGRLRSRKQEPEAARR
ncbi:MAG: response regulator [Planctomycetota bacterium]